jgi:hypothetical protein
MGSVERYVRPEYPGIEFFKVTHPSGLSAILSTYGALLLSLRVPRPNQGPESPEEVTLGFGEDLSQYQKNLPGAGYFGKKKSRSSFQIMKRFQRFYIFFFHVH